MPNPMRLTTDLEFCEHATYSNYRPDDPTQRHIENQVFVVQRRIEDPDLEQFSGLTVKLFASHLSLQIRDESCRHNDCTEEESDQACNKNGWVAFAQILLARRFVQTQ